MFSVYRSGVAQASKQICNTGIQWNKIGLEYINFICPLQKSVLSKNYSLQYGRCAVERCSSCMTVWHDTSTFYIFVDVTTEWPWKKFRFCKSQSFNNWENDLKSFNSDLAFMSDSQHNWILIIVFMFDPTDFK